MHAKLIVGLAVCALAGVAQAQTTNRPAGDAARNTANNVGAAAKAAVTPGDQNMGRDPNNRTGGLMGDDRTGAVTGTATDRRAARADRN